MTFLCIGLEPNRMSGLRIISVQLVVELIGIDKIYQSEKSIDRN